MLRRDVLKPLDARILAEKPQIVFVVQNGIWRLLFGVKPVYEVAYSF
jgi:hypothetical protein